jgi:hypothetical protein
MRPPTTPKHHEARETGSISFKEIEMTAKETFEIVALDRFLVSGNYISTCKIGSARLNIYSDRLMDDVGGTELEAWLALPGVKY